MLEDGDPEYQPKPEIEGEGEDAGVDLSWIAGVGHKQEVVKVEPETKSFESKVPGMRKCTVYFDNWTHRSGNRRAFIGCTEHDRCRLYVFLKDFHSEERAVSFLFAWVFSAHRWPDRSDAHEHIGSKPSSIEVDDVMREQFPTD